jgi:anti-sigma B factor antagonist
VIDVLVVPSSMLQLAPRTPRRVSYNPGVVSLSIKTRRVGDITIVTCIGRIVEGEESAALQRDLAEILSRDPYIILDLAGVDFIDSSGLGLVVRFLNRARSAGGGLKLCAVPARVAEVLRITNLAPIFESWPTEAEAIAAFYQPTTASAASFKFNTGILCVDKSANVLAGIRELLGQAGYGAMSADNLSDALILLQSTRPSLVVIGADLRAASNTSTATRFNKLASGLSVVELPFDFSNQDAGEAGRRLVDQVRAVMGPAGKASGA